MTRPEPSKVTALAEEVSRLAVDAVDLAAARTQARQAYDQADRDARRAEEALREARAKLGAALDVIAPLAPQTQAAES